ncbi:unnamed protein product, partial [Laminaria digitata]
LLPLFRDLAGVTAGVAFLHSHGIGHNDLKPANILLFPGESEGARRAKLADLGLS